MTEEEKEELKSLIDSNIESIKQEITELKELTKPVSLDASIGRLSRMDAITNKAINEKALREKKVLFKNWSVPGKDIKRISREPA